MQTSGLRRRNSTFRGLIPLAALSLLLCLSGPADSTQSYYEQKHYTSGQDEVYSSFTIGVYLLEKGAVSNALDYLEAAWAESGHDAVIGLKLADAYSRVGRLDESESVINTILATNERDLDALLFKSQLLYLRGDRAHCAETLEKIAAAEPADFEIQQLLGKVYYELGNDKKAIEAYGNALRLDPNYPYLFYRYGLLLRKDGRDAEAKDAFEKALALDPDFHESAVELSDILIESKRYARAESLLTGVLAAQPSNGEALISLAMLYFNQGSYDNGIRVLEERKRSAPLSREASILLGRMYYEAKEYTEALAIFKELNDQGGARPDLSRILGEISQRAGNEQEALGYFREAIRLDPNDYKNYLSLFYASDRRFIAEDVAPVELTADERNGLLPRAASLVAADDFEGLYMVGITYQNVDSLDRARTILKRSLALRPDDRTVLLALAGIEEKTKNFAEAEKHLETLYNMKPDDPAINNFYGYLLAEQGKDLAKAEKMIGKALEMEPANGYYLDSLGWVFYQRGDYEKALEELEKASNIVANDSVILEHLGDAYRAMKQYRKALAVYEQSREIQGKNQALIEKIESLRKGMN
jgi:tetratricopeptide (TPR) repeat protein